LKVRRGDAREGSAKSTNSSEEGYELVEVVESRMASRAEG